MPAVAIWTFVRGLPWKQIGIALAVIGLAVLLWRAPWAEKRGFHKRDGEVAAYRQTISDMKAASAKALADAQEHARSIETAQNVATQETSHELEAQLTAARGAAAAYAARLRLAQAAAGGTGQAGAARSPDAAGGPAGAGPVSELDDDDLRLCSENTIKAIGWRAWWLKISQIPR